MTNPTEQSPYQGLPSNRFWRTGVAEQHPLSITDLYQRKFAIGKETRIATAGSCFAQHIGRRLAARGFNVLDYEPKGPKVEPELASKFGYGLFSARYGNIYLARQLLQLAREALGHWTPADIMWRRGDRFYDALRPGVEPDGLDSVEEVAALRGTHLAAVARLLRDTELFIFTFGLTEGWIHRDSGTVYPTAPATIAGRYDPAVHAFKNFTFAEIYDDFLAFRALLRSLNPAMRFLLTVSPVPLTATASSDHVLSATIYSKSVLRAVAGQLSQEHADIDYFPSYELIASHWSGGAFFDLNLRTVTSEGVEAAMRLFFSQHDPQGTVAKESVEAEPFVRRTVSPPVPDGGKPIGKGQLSKEERQARRARRQERQERRARRQERQGSDGPKDGGRSRADVVCEEELLEAFRK
jgi:hypothetical protein